MATQIYIVDDHAIMRQALSEFLSTEIGMEIVGKSETAEEALEALTAPDMEVDLALVDTALPGMDGIELVGMLQEQRPGLRCVMLSGHGEATYVDRALKAGARGYILKGDPYELPGAIEHILEGGVYLSEPLQDGVNP